MDSKWRLDNTTQQTTRDGEKSCQADLTQIAVQPLDVAAHMPLQKRVGGYLAAADDGWMAFAFSQHRLLCSLQFVELLNNSGRCMMYPLEKLRFPFGGHYAKIT